MLETSARRTSSLTGPSISAPYAEALALHAARETVSFVVPGHGATPEGIAEGQAEFFGERALSLDVSPLLDGVDLGTDSPKQAALALAAEAWGAKRTWFLTNGSSQGNRIAAIAARGLGGDVVMQRSAHSSFVDGIILAGLRPSFVQPSVDLEHGIAHGVTATGVAEAIAAHPGTPTAVYVVSPSYFGAVADIPAIAEVVHDAGAALIVDGAWGAHFGFHPELPASPMTQGADLAIMSTHKLTGSLTQSAILHLGHGPFAARLEPFVERAFSMNASTSESSLLLSSIDLARRDLVGGREALDRSLASVLAWREEFRREGTFPIVSDTFGAYPDIVGLDPFRVPIDITATGLDGHTVRGRLVREFGIIPEMSTVTTIVAVVGAGKTPDFGVLLRALHELRAEAREQHAGAGAVELPPLPGAGPSRMLPRAAFFGTVEQVSWREAIGRVSADSLAAYPPGIPNVLPGEEITAEAVEFLRASAAAPSGYVRGAADPAVDTFRVVVAPAE